jgi:phage tail-like protein
MGRIGDPALGLHFKVTIDGHLELGNWQRCDGLQIDYDIHEYREGGMNAYVHRLPGRARYENIRLTRPVDSTSMLVAAWVGSVQLRLVRGTARVAVVDPEGDTIAVWNLIDVFPARWTGPSLDVSGNQVATETLELVHNGFLGPR